MQFIIEDQLVPMMIRNGFDLTGCTFKYDESESLPLAEQAKIDVSFLQAGIKLEHEYLEHKYGVEIMDGPGMEEEEEEEEEDTMPKEVIKVENKLRNLYK